MALEVVRRRKVVVVEVEVGHNTLVLECSHMG